MPLTPDERNELHRIERQARALRAKKNEEAKARGREQKRQVRKAIDRAQAGQRKPRVHDKGFLAFLRRQPCCVGPRGCSGPVQAAHIRFSDFKVGRVNPGGARKSDDRWANPLCEAHHAAQHARGDERAWWNEQGLDPNENSQRLYAAYLGEAGE